jgi:hypothetical protein
MLKRDASKHIIILILNIVLIIVLISGIIPTVISVELNSGSQSPSNLEVGDIITINNVRLTIRKTERIDINYLKFSIYDSINNEVAYVSFDIFGNKIAESPTGSFTVESQTDINKFYSSGGSSYGIDELTNEYIPFYNSGYGHGSQDLDIIYKITYVTKTSGTFFTKLLVNSSLHNYFSSIIFTVNPSNEKDNQSTQNNLPIADAGEFYSGLVNTTIIFNGSNSIDLDGIITNYFWDFGDGFNGTGITTSHSYNTSGIYILTLIITDNKGRNATDETNVIIFEEGVLQHPIADPGGPYFALTYQNITFDGIGSYDPDGTITNYVWDFDDGELGLGKKQEHQYRIAGDFTIKLTVIDSDGLEDTKITNVTIALDSDADGWSNEFEISYKKDAYDPIDFPIDTDKDGIPDESSHDGIYQGDKDDDNDEIDDETEIALTSNPKSSSDVNNITINGKKSYMVDTEGDRIFNKYYNPKTDTITDTHYIGGKYFINTDEDPQWDYVYNPALGTIQQYETKKAEKTYEEPNKLVPIIIVIAVIALIIIIIAALFKTGYLYIEEITVENSEKKSRENK